MKKHFFLLSLLMFLIFYFSEISLSQPRQHISLDKGWKFHLGSASSAERDFGYGLVSIYSKNGKSEGTAIYPGFDDSHWRNVDLPHDWAIELPFVNHPSSDVMSHGYKPIGGYFPENSIGWYRRSFDIPSSDSGFRFSLTFDGVYRDAKFWLNGYYLGNNESGYSGIEYDITDFVWFDKPNVLVVRVDATQYEGWFYEGAGIYRHVWLNRYPEIHIPSNGVFAYSIPKGKSSIIHLEITIINSSLKDNIVGVETQIKSRDGRVMARTLSKSISISALGESIINQDIKIDHPHLWNLDDPYLYRIETSIVSDDKIIDRTSMPFGIRSIKWDADKGFFLNDRPIKLLGVNMHQGHAGLGVALPDGMQYYRINRLKQMGANAYRCSHHPPTPELLDACDSLGMLVINENRLLNTSPEYFDQFSKMVIRDRNHPSVILWSIGNEEGYIQTNGNGKRMAITLIEKLKRLDPSRKVTYAADVSNVFKGINEVIPIRGFNYREEAMEDYHKDHPHQPIIGTEMGSTVTTRGIYSYDSINCYLPDLDLTAPWWASRADEWWPIVAENPWAAGGFIWTGMDYMGEPTPFHWPNIGSHFGVMDQCGFPKNLYYYYQSWWDTTLPVLNIAPHWNWLNRWGFEPEVWIDSNADSVNLKLNGKDLGTRLIQKNQHLKWKVKYEPGLLEAKGYKNGFEFISKIETTGPAFELVVSPHKTTAIANSTDVVVINISAVDTGGREVPTANNRVRFKVTGPAKIIGVGNGDPSSHEPDKCETGLWQRSLFQGKCQVILQMGDTPGKVGFEASTEGLWPASTEIHTLPASFHNIAPAIDQIKPSGLPDGERIMGADISFLPQLEAEGMKFYDFGSNVPEDVFEILKKYGFNYIRLRIFYQPENPEGYSPDKGYCNLKQTLEMARRIKKAGMKFLLDFHYSDYWADPGKQYKPAAWASLPFEILKDSVRNYTVRVLLALKAQGTLPDMIQPGNEINHGMLWPEGHISQPDQLSGLLEASISGIKEVAPEVPIMLHLALGGQNEESVFWLNNMFARGIDCDIIGLSYYPRWHCTLDDLKYNMRDLIRRYGKDIIVVEYSQKKEEVAGAVFALPNGKGKGCFIWEPLNTWEGIFDKNGKPTRWLHAYENIKAMYLDENSKN